MRIARLVLLVSSSLAASCGGARPAPPAEPKTQPVPTATTAAAEPTPSPEPAKPAATEPAVPDAAAPAASKPEPDPNATREVTYVVVPEGLKISVAGVRFTVSASAVQVASGWGVKLNVGASPPAGKPHSLSSPKSGPLAFAGAVLRKGRSEAEPF